MKKQVFRFALVLVLLTISSAGFASPVRWYLQGVTMSDGARAVGSFVFDADTSQYSEVDVATTIGSEATGATFSDPNPDSPGNVNGLLFVMDGSLEPLTGQPVFTIEYSTPLSNAGGTVEVNTEGFSFEGQCLMGQGDDTRECGSIGVARTFLAGTITSIKPGAFISAGFNGAWFNPDTSGQGILLDVYPTIPLLFIAWFTFDTGPEPAGSTAVVGDPNHRWLTAQGTFRANEAVLDIFLTTGGFFNDPTRVSNSNANSYGRIVLTFNNDCRTATMEFDLFSQRLQDTNTLQRIADDNVNLCLQLAKTAAAPAPTGSIVYQFLPTGSFSLSEIHRINPDGSGDTALTNDGAGNGDAAPSPDGSKVAFSRNNMVYVMDADGSNQQSLAAGRFPDFSPNGQMIVYSSGNGIQIMEANGTFFDNPRSTGSMPDWSPDGNQIVFREGTDIWVMAAGGNASTNLTNNPLGTSAASPRWSPDGSTIAFESCQGSFCHILLMDSLGKSVRNLTSGEVVDFLPDWSPDGESISFERSGPGDGTFDIWVARRDGSVIKRVTTSGKASTAKWGVSPP